MDTARFFPNPAAVSAAVSSASKSTSNGLLLVDERDWTSVASDLLDKCIRNNRSHPLGTLYVGALGPRTYLRWRMARLLGKESADAKHLLRSALTEVQKELKSDVSTETTNNPLTKPSARHSRKSVVSLLEGSYVGCKALSAVIHHDLGDATTARQEATELIEALDVACLALTPDECEVLYGRAGALQTILFLRESLQQESLGSVVALSLARSILQQGQRIASTRDQGLSLLWVWHDSYYLGAAHGVVGILQMILSLHPDELKELEKDGFITSIRKVVTELDAYCFASGNLDSSIHTGRGGGRDRLVHWCHGATGHVILLVKAAQVFQDDTCFEKAKKIALEVIWHRGLLRKGVGLCHGISGNAYALLSVGRRDASFQAMARYFANFALDHLEELEDTPDHPYSLFEGLGGLCSLAMDLANPGQSHFPLYEFGIQVFRS